MSGLRMQSVGALLAMGLSAPLFAFYNTLATHSAVSVTGTYFKTSNDEMGVGSFISSSEDASEVRPFFVSPTHDVNYALGYTYRIPCTQAHFFATYEHYYTRDGRNDSGFIGSIVVGGEDAASSASVQQSYNNVKAGFSTLLMFSPRFEVDLIGFFAWDKISRSFLRLAQAGTGNDTEAASFTSDDSMQGWGPGVGVVATIKPFYDLNWGFFVDVKTTLLWAKNTFSAQLISPPSEVDLPGRIAILPQDSHSLVGKLDLLFGVNYCRAFKYANIQTDLGLRYMNVFNALKNGNTFGSFIQGNAISLSGPATDWGFWGPFLKLTIGGKEA